MIRLLAALDFGRGQAGNTALERGWAAPEDGFVWSAGPESTILLPPLPTPEGVWLELKLAPFVQPAALAHQHVRLSVNGVAIAERRLGDETTWRLQMPPEPLRCAPEIRLMLQHPDAASPASLGHGGDARALGTRISHLVLLHDPDMADLPKHAGRFTITHRYTFGCNESSEDVLGEGWGAPDAGAVWALGPHSVLRLIPPAGGAYTVVIQARAFIDPPRMVQRVAVGMNGRLLQYVAITDHISMAFDLPPVVDGEPIELTFDNLDAAAPRGHGLAPDGRPFAFMLLRLTLLRQATPGAEFQPAALPPVSGNLEDGRLQRNVLALAGMPVEQLVTKFESLGNACDFGLLQRRFGQEPAGLMRFAGIHSPHLIEGILNGFPGLGRPDTLEVLQRNDDQCGYWVIDCIYALSFQTPISSLTADHATLKRSLARTMPFLRRKFFQDTVAGERIFIFQRRTPTTRPEAEAVLAALACWGDPTVLWTIHDPAQPAGSVVRLGPRLLCGYLDPPSAPFGYASDAVWISVLANAVASREGLLF